MRVSPLDQSREPLAVLRPVHQPFGEQEAALVAKQVQVQPVLAGELN